MILSFKKTSLNNKLGGYSFGETADGKPGYRKPGADTVFPFKGDDVATYYAGSLYFGNVSKNTQIEIELPFTPKAVAVEYQWSTSWSSVKENGWKNDTGFVTNELVCNTGGVRYLQTSLCEDAIVFTNLINLVGNVWFAVFDKPIFDK